MHQTAAPVHAHLPAENLRAEEIAGQVDRQHRIPFGERQVFEPTRPQDAGGIDQNATWSQRLLDRPGCGSDTLGARGVAGCDDMLAAESRNSSWVTSRPRWSRSTPATRTPALARLSATARPTPPPAPVTTPTRPDRPSQSEEFCPVITFLPVCFAASIAETQTGAIAALRRLGPCLRPPRRTTQRIARRASWRWNRSGANPVARACRRSGRRRRNAGW